MATVTLDGKTYEVVQARFHKWLDLVSIREDILKEADHPDKQAKLVCQYVSASLSINDDISDLDWKEVAQAFIECVTINTLPVELPFLKSTTKTDKPAWDYKSRSWWSLCLLMAKEFGWEIEYIENLEVEAALSLIQEILLEEQFEKEWQWLLSERAAKYNEATKKYEPNPLPRPDWMSGVPKPAKKIKIPAKMLPIGVIVKARPDDQDYYTN